MIGKLEVISQRIYLDGQTSGGEEKMAGWQMPQASRPGRDKFRSDPRHGRFTMPYKNAGTMYRAPTKRIEAAGLRCESGGGRALLRRASLRH